MPDAPFAPAPGGFTSGVGAVYKPLHVERQVKVYPIQEHELLTLNMFSGITTIAMSFAGGAAGFLLNVWWEVATSNDPTKTKIGDAVMMVCGGIIAICLVIAAWAQWKKRSELDAILKESRVVSPPG